MRNITPEPCAADVAKPAGERPAVKKTERHEARAKGRAATLCPEQADKEDSPTWATRPVHRDASPQAQSQENPSGGSHNSVESVTRSNAVSERADPLVLRGRQHPERRLGQEALGRSGVVGWACGEGLAKEGGRSHRVPEGVTRAATSLGRERGAIRARPEGLPETRREVGGARSSDEAAVMVVDAKGPHFGTAEGGGLGCPSHRKV